MACKKFKIGDTVRFKYEHRKEWNVVGVISEIVDSNHPDNKDYGDVYFISSKENKGLFGGDEHLERVPDKNYERDYDEEQV
jgi:hypothetical protein